jgi:hypothetical protein
MRKRVCRASAPRANVERYLPLSPAGGLSPTAPLSNYCTATRQERCGIWNESRRRAVEFCRRPGNLNETVAMDRLTARSPVNARQQTLAAISSRTATKLGLRTLSPRPPGVTNRGQPCACRRWPSPRRAPARSQRSLVSGSDSAGEVRNSPRWGVVPNRGRLSLRARSARQAMLPDSAGQNARSCCGVSQQPVPL